MSKQVAFIGATGMLGRPVARRLVNEELSVKAMVRNVDAAKRVLPPQIKLVQGDLQSWAMEMIGRIRYGLLIMNDFGHETCPLLAEATWAEIGKPEKTIED